MIKYFSIENYYSIRKENIVEFDLNKSNDRFAAHPIIGFAGTNASGKTNFVKGLNFLLWFIGDSFFSRETKIPLEKFIGNENLPTKFSLIFSIEENQQFEYELEVNNNKILSEVLSTNDEVIYTRSLKDVQFGKMVTPFSTKDLRDSSSIISYATNFDSHTFAKEIRTFFSKGGTNVDVKGHRNIEFNTSNLIELSDEIYKSKAIELAKIADIGIVDFFVENKESLNILHESAFFKHKIGHSLSDFTPEQESSGTLQFFAMLSSILPILENGGILILDEIEIKLHQNLVAYMIGLFQNQEYNKKNAQLIFTFHNSLFMDILQPEQLWFAEKNSSGETELFCAANFTDIKDIQTKSLEKLYRIGRFGAKPIAI